jgi:site-specific recombinase XerD
MNLENLRENRTKLILYLEEHDYEKSYIAHFRSVLKTILKNSDEKGWSNYEDVYHYFESIYSPHTCKAYKSVLIAIRSFDFHNKYPDGTRAMLTDDSPKTLLCDDFNLLVEYYRSAEDDQGRLKDCTIESNACSAGTFFRALQAIGITTISDITEEAVLSVFLSAEGGLLKGDSYSRSVKEVLYKCSELFPTESVMIMIPVAKKHRKNIQYLTPEETRKIRAALTSAASPLTLRERAIGTLAYYTGLRGCDISGLNLDSIDLKNDRIHIIQAKTQEPLDIPLKAVVGNAIYDYVTLERPKSNNPAVFLTRHLRRLSSGAMFQVSVRIMNAAGIRQGEKQRKGLHIFRHHLATTLLGKGIPQPVISGTLGQVDPVSLEAYLSSDFVNLKSCALNVDRFPLAKEVLL